MVKEKYTLRHDESKSSIYMFTSNLKISLTEIQKKSPMSLQKGVTKIIGGNFGGFLSKYQ